MGIEADKSSETLPNFPVNEELKEDQLNQSMASNGRGRGRGARGRGRGRGGKAASNSVNRSQTLPEVSDRRLSEDDGLFDYLKHMVNNEDQSDDP